MMRRFLLPMAALAVLTVGPAFAAPAATIQSEVQMQAGTSAASKPKKEKKICRSLETTGSNIPKSECHTAAEWKQIDSASGVDQNDMQRMQRQMSPH